MTDIITESEITVSAPEGVAFVGFGADVYMTVEHRIEGITSSGLRDAIADIVDMRRRGVVGTIRIYDDHTITFHNDETHEIH